MKFYNLKSIVVSQKVACDMRMPTDSFYIAPPRPTPYIEPTFSKIDFETERPQVVLISAVGATGKSALAHVCQIALAFRCSTWKAQARRR